MAPSTIETSAFTGRQNANLTLKVIGETGPYQKLSPIEYEKEVEEIGRDGFEPAKVSYILPSPTTVLG